MVYFFLYGAWPGANFFLRESPLIISDEDEEGVPEGKHSERRIFG